MKPTPAAIEAAARRVEKYFADNKKDFYPHEEISEVILSGDLGDMVLVPREPTNEMQISALSYVMRQHQTRDVYRAMIAAAEGDE